MGRRLIKLSIVGGVFLASIVAAMSVGLAISSCWLASSQEGTPTAVLDRTHWDFGTVTSPGPRTASFRLSNTGQQRLIIRKQHQSCECLSVDAELIVLPGRSIELPVVLQPIGMQGPVKTEVSYGTNDSARPKLTLQVLANVQIEGSDQDRVDDASVSVLVQEEAGER